MNLSSQRRTSHTSCASPQKGSNHYLSTRPFSPKSLSHVGPTERRYLHLSVAAFFCHVFMAWTFECIMSNRRKTHNENHCEKLYLFLERCHFVILSLFYSSNAVTIKTLLVNVNFVLNIMNIHCPGCCFFISRCHTKMCFEAVFYYDEPRCRFFGCVHAQVERVTDQINGNI